MATLDSTIFANILDQVPKAGPLQGACQDENVLRWYSEGNSRNPRPSMTMEQRVWCTEQVALDLDLSSFLTPDQASVLHDCQLARAVLTHHADIARKRLRA